MVRVGSNGSWVWFGFYLRFVFFTLMLSDKKKRKKETEACIGPHLPHAHLQVAFWILSTEFKCLVRYVGLIHIKIKFNVTFY